MIHYKTMLDLRNKIPGLKGFVLDRSPNVGQWILLLFILTVVYMAIKPCDCAIVDERFERFEGSEVSYLAPPSRAQEHPVLEEGGSDAPIHEVSNASRLFWRWHEGDASRDIVEHSHGARHYWLRTSQAKIGAPTLAIRSRATDALQDLSRDRFQIFLAREVDALAHEQARAFSHVFAVEDGVAYLAYFPKEKGIGVEIYALDLEHNSPLWRTTVRTPDFHADVETDVQLFLHDNRLQIMTREGELRRIDELSTRTGEILSMQEVDVDLTRFPVQEAMHETFYTRCVFHVDASGAEDRPDCALAPPLSEMLADTPSRGTGAMSVVRRHEPSDTVYWRLNPIGQRFTLFPVSKLWPEPTTDILLSHTPGHSASVLIALDHASGDMLWSTGLSSRESRKASSHGEPFTHHLVRVDVSRVGGEPALVVYGEEDEEIYTTYLDPRTGEIRAMLRAPRAE